MEDNNFFGDDCYDLSPAPNQAQPSPSFQSNNVNQAPQQPIVNPQPAQPQQPAFQPIAQQQPQPAFHQPAQTQPQPPMNNFGEFQSFGGGIFNEDEYEAIDIGTFVDKRSVIPGQQQIQQPSFQPQQLQPTFQQQAIRPQQNGANLSYYPQNGRAAQPSKAQQPMSYYPPNGQPQQPQQPTYYPQNGRPAQPSMMQRPQQPQQPTYYPQNGRPMQQPTTYYGQQAYYANGYPQSQSSVFPMMDPAYYRTMQIRSKVKRIYNMSFFGFFIQFAIAMGIALVAALIASVAMGFDSSLTNLTSLAMTISAISYVPANILASVIMNKKASDGTVKFRNFFRKPKFSGLSFVFALVATLAIQTSFSTLWTAFGDLAGEGRGVFGNSLGMNDEFPVLAMISILYTTVFAPVFEEILCRGSFLGAMGCVKKKFAVLMSALMFGLMHGNIQQFLNAFLVGLIIGVVACKAKSIILGIVLHMCLNCHAFFLAFIETELPEPMIYIYAAILIAVGIPLMILFFKREGHLEEDDTHSPEIVLNLEPAERKQYTMRVLKSCPWYWIVFIFYVAQVGGTALLSIVP